MPARRTNARRAAPAPARRLLVVDGFAREGKALRAHFDQRFAAPGDATEGRFVWDLWHVEGQYTALRTPAWRYFPAKLYRAFHERLVWWGRRTLGCHDVSPPWLGCYVDGCEQRWHGDLPHGHWAFVYSLTDWERRTFQGGETLLLKDEALDFWRGFTSTRQVEEGELVEAIAPRFDRLTVFDPRLPHAVRPVRGSMDPRQGRLVVHGWFVQPRPFIEGPLTERQLGSCVDAVSQALAAADVPEVAGLLSFSFRVATSGRVSALRLLCDTTRTPLERERGQLVRALTASIARHRFAPQRGPSRVTLPVVFERG